MPLGVFNSLCLTTMNISAWAFIVYSCERVFQYLCLKNKQKEVPRFFYNYTNGAFGANIPQNIQYNEETSFAPFERYAVCILSVSQ